MIRHYAYVVSISQVDRIGRPPQGSRKGPHMPIINDSNRDAITQLVVQLRDEGVKWDIEGGIRDQVAEAFPVYTSKSAIPLRKLYHGAKEAKFNPKTKSGAVKLVKLRD